MNKWPTPPPEVTIDSVAKAIKKKNKSVDIRIIKSQIKKYIRAHRW